MKRKLKGLLSLWLAVLMLLSMASVVSFAEDETGETVYLYQETTPIKSGDYYKKPDSGHYSLPELVGAGIFSDISGFTLGEPIDLELTGLDEMPTTPDGYELNGWKLWAYGSGMNNPVDKAINGVISDEDYNTDYRKFIEPIWKVKYAFTKQPTAIDPSVEVNIPTDVASYQWYKVDPIREITTENASVVTGSEFGLTGDSSYSEETGWNGASDANLDAGDEPSSYTNCYFSIALNAGDTIRINSENELLGLVLLDSEQISADAELIVTDKIYTITAPENGTYTLVTLTSEANAAIRAELIPAFTTDSSVTGSTDKKLMTDTEGTYLCEVTFKYNDLNSDEPIKLYSDRVTLENCTITFDAGEGSGTMEDATVLSGSEYTLPECEFEAPAGKEFDAWEVDGKEYDEGDKLTIEADTTVKALWKAKQSAKVATPVISPDGGKFTTSSLDVKISCATSGATIYYTTNGDTPTTASSKYNGRVVISSDTTLKAIAVKDGMERSAVASVYFDKQASGNSGNSSSGSSGSSYGGSSTRSYTVKFDTNGGLTVASQYITRNKTVTEPENVTKYGYTFEGWYTDEAFTTKYDFSTPVTSSFTLYAKWSDGTGSSDSTGAAADNRIILTIGQYKMQVFGRTVEMDVVPQIVNDRTMLPARFVAEALDAIVEWNESEPDKVRITKDSTEIIIYIGSATAYVNGESVTLDSASFLENDRTYVPVRFICENLGATVDWDEGEQQVIIVVNN